jgi:hypothetical protein
MNERNVEAEPSAALEYSFSSEAGILTEFERVVDV